jgi:hypothetical protein
MLPTAGTLQRISAQVKNDRDNIGNAKSTIKNPINEWALQKNDGNT